MTSISTTFGQTLDPFKDASVDEDGTAGVQEGLIHIRIQQRNGRKTLTTVQGISPDYDLKMIVKACKRNLHAMEQWLNIQNTGSNPVTGRPENTYKGLSENRRHCKRRSTQGARFLK